MKTISKVSKRSKGIKKEKDSSSTATASSNSSKKGAMKVDPNRIVKTVSVWSNQKDYFQMDRCYDDW